MSSIETDHRSFAQEQMTTPEQLASFHISHFFSCFEVRYLIPIRVKRGLLFLSGFCMLRYENFEMTSQSFF